MLKSIKIFITLGLIIFALLLHTAESSTGGDIKIMTTILPLADFAQAVCGRYGTVEMLLPPGAEVHTWNPRPSDIIKLADTDLFIYIGADLEPWVKDILESVKNPRLRIIEAAKNILQATPHEEHAHTDEEHESAHTSGLDPHIWLDFSYDLKIIDVIQENLIEILPEQKKDFAANAMVYKNKLRDLDRRYRETLQFCTNRTLVIGGHAAFGYLAQRYQLRQIALYGLSPDAKPSPRQLLEVIKTAKQYAIEVIFFEAYVATELSDVLAAEIGARTSVLNPGANLTKKELEQGITFLALMERNLENLKNGLSCR